MNESDLKQVRLSRLFTINQNRRADYKPPEVSDEKKRRQKLRARVEDIALQRQVTDDKAAGSCMRCKMLDAADGSKYCHDCASDLSRLCD